MQAVQQYQLKGDELLIAVFNQFSKGEDFNFRDESNIMLAFYKASKNSAYKDLYKNYRFDEDGIEAFCKEIADGISTLHQSSLMSKLNPSFSIHRLTQGIDIRFDNFIGYKLNDEQKDLIKKLSEEIKQDLV